MEMGRIFSRIKSIIKSRKINDDFLDEFSGFDINSDDEELNKAIDDAINDKESKKVQENSGGMGRESALEILGLSPYASLEEIKAAYKRKIKEYHPDKVAAMGDEIKILAEKRTQEINAAFVLLKNEQTS
jgi:DnaJ-domain-containing protein 1